MRLFIAVNPDPGAAQHLQQAIEPLRDDPALSGVRWVPVDRWHITLAFIGEVESAHLPRLVEALTNGLAKAPAALPLHCHSAGQFGDRLLWMGVAGTDHGDQVPLLSLARSVRRITRRSGLPVDTQRWQPHLTIGRDRQGAGATAASRSLAHYCGPSWQPREVLVVSSILGPSPVHQVQAAIPLR